MENLFKKNLSTEHGTALVNLRANQSFAEKLISQIKGFYDVRTEYKRRNDTQSCYVVEPHTYARFEACRFEVTSKAVTLEVSVGEYILSEIAGKKASFLHDTWQKQYDKLYKAATTEEGKRKSFDVAKVVADGQISKLLKPMGWTMKRRQDSSCGDSFELSTELKNDIHSGLDKKIGILMNIFQSKNIKIRLEAV